jgi:hypothetical protein
LAARRLEAFGHHLGDGALGEFFVPPGQRSAVQVREALGIGRQRFDLSLEIAPIINL